MRSDDPGESAAEILAVSKNAGVSLTVWMIRRWHRAGLLPKPVQKYRLGTGGSETIYPIGTTNQLLALCKFIELFPRSLQLCGEALWWRGFPVGHKYWRDVLQNSAAWYDLYAPQFLQMMSADNSAEPLETLRTFRTEDKIFRQIRKRLGPKYFAVFLEFLGQIINGEFEGWATYVQDGSDSDKMAIDKAIRLGRVRNARKLSQRPIVYDDFENVFKLMSARLGGLKLTEIYQSLSDRQIVAARNELRLLFWIAKYSNTAIGSFASRRGLQTLIDISDQILFTKIGQVMLLFLAALKEEPTFQQSVGNAIAEFRKSARVSISSEKIEFLSSVDPALAQIIYESGPHRY